MPSTSPSTQYTHDNSIGRRSLASYGSSVMGCAQSETRGVRELRYI